MEKKVTGRRIARLAWTSLFEAVRAMPLIFLTAIGLLVALEFGNGFLWAYLPRATLVDLIFMAVLTFAQVAVMSWVQVAMNRFILLDEAGINVHPAIVLRFAAWLMPFYLPRILLGGHPSLGTLMTILFWASWIVVVWILLLFPAIAVGEESESPLNRLKTAIRRVQGHFWLMQRSLLITVVPVFFAFPVIILMINAIQTPPGATDAAPSTAMLWLIGAGGWAFFVLTAALGAAASSWLYSHLTESHLINEF